MHLHEPSKLTCLTNFCDSKAEMKMKLIIIHFCLVNVPLEIPLPEFEHCILRAHPFSGAFWFLPEMSSIHKL